MFEAEFTVKSLQQPQWNGPFEVELVPVRGTHSLADFPYPLEIGGALTLKVPHAEAAAKFELGKSVSIQINIKF